LIFETTRHTVTRLRATTVNDSYGDPVESWTNPSTMPLPRAVLYDGASLETETSRATTTSSDRVLHVPYRVDLAENDRIQDGSEVWRVDGKPIVRRGLASTEYTTANLVRFEG